MKRDIKDLTIQELTKEIKEMGQPAHRTRQIFLWLYRKNADDFSLMTDIPKDLSGELKEKYTIGTIELSERKKAKDEAEKFLWRLKDGEYIESVYIKQGSRNTLCISTQVGCKFKCPFCASGMRGLKRNLRPGEIVNQLLSAQKTCKCRMTNVVFMGMGEPLDNYDNLEKAIKIINDPNGIALGARKITISTCGIIPGIRKLKKLGIQVELSVSLHSADNNTRNELVPSNRKYPVKDLIKECKSYTSDTGRIITLEYAVIKGKNDSMKDADSLSKIAKDLKAKVNLIQCNVVEGFSAGPGDEGSLIRFRDRLKRNGVTVTVRRSRGRDIAAACGQLAAKKT